MIKRLFLKNLGPAPKFNIEFGDRLNIFTGDNGLGKSFLLDIVWWALTGTWADNSALPHQDNRQVPEISCQIKEPSGLSKPRKYQFDFSKQLWPTRKQIKPGIQNPAIYLRVDGNFSVWDPIRNTSLTDESNWQPDAYHFTPEALWNGLELKNKIVCNGLIRDWVTWQYKHPQEQSNTSPFTLLESVLETLSPGPEELIKPAKPKRISVGDVRDIPTVDLPYGNVPITHVSAGMKRILSLAYLTVWLWFEHTQAAKLKHVEPTEQLVILMDEVEAHLHPQWQRAILTSLLILENCLSTHLKTQVIVTSHSPLVLASAETIFQQASDKLFLFKLEGKDVKLDELPWTKYGDAVGWLTSNVFGLHQARSREAELVINAAYAFMRGESLDNFPQNMQSKEQIHNELKRVLPGHDPFWVRWIIKEGEKK